MKKISLGLFLLVGIARAESPPSGFCQAKTDYTEGATCEGVFMARNQADLNSYAQNFGLSDGKYKDLIIGVALTGEEHVIHSPCKISTFEMLTHTANNICLDGRQGVTISHATVASGQKMHLLSLGGNIIFKSTVSIQSGELEIYTGGKVHLNTGVSITSTTIRLVSTSTDTRGIPIAIGLGTRVSGTNIRIVGRSKINFSGHFVRADNNLDIETQTGESHTGVSVFRNTMLQARTLNVLGGNRFEVRMSAVLKASSNLHVNALGCKIHDQAILEGSSFSGSCLNENNVNDVPTAVIRASLTKQVVPFTVMLSGGSSSDSDGSIQGYLWTFHDGTTASGRTTEREFTVAGSHVVKLTVTDNDGAMGEAEIMITAKAPFDLSHCGFEF